ncbi:MAG: hypothetical protein IPJ90_08225 [Anaerolineaceae bacterium]|nr:hypothetical protein [Anaerolineaceae bacterium]
MITALPASTHTAVANNYSTIILVDNGRMGGDLTTMQAQLAAFAARPEVNGVIVDVNSDARVAAANAQADTYTACPFAKTRPLTPSKILWTRTGLSIRWNILSSSATMT